MYEVEVKVRADHDVVRERLTSIGASPLGVVRQRDTYYDHPDRSFAETDEALRIRRERSASADEADVTLTYKGPRVDAETKTRRELETRLGDADAAEKTLAALDFSATADVRKDRERFELDGYTVTLDRVDGLGEFVEVETVGDERELDELRDGAREILSRLGLDDDAGIRASYLELLVEE